MLQSDFTEHWDDAGVEPLHGLLQGAAGRDLFGAAKKLHDDQMQPLYAGAAADGLTDIPGAAEIVDRIVEEAWNRLDRWQH